MNRSANEDAQEGPEPKSYSATKTLDELDAKLKALKMKYPAGNPNLKNAVKLYLHIGVQPKPYWVLKVGSKTRARVSTNLQLKMFGDQRRVDFVWNGVWALKFMADEVYRSFITEFQNCLFENVYGLQPTDESRVKVYGKDFLGWVKPETTDDSIWEDADDDEWKTPVRTPVRGGHDLLEEFEEASTRDEYRAWL